MDRMAQTNPPEDLMQYEAMAQDALRGVVKAALRKAAAPGGLPEPYVAVGPDHLLWVTDPSGKRVLLFDTSGAPLGTATPATPLEVPLGIVATGRGHAMVVDSARNRLVPLQR